MRRVAELESFGENKMTDKRLIGLWRSDQKRTMAGWNYPKGLSPKLRKFTRTMFGKLRLRFTAKRIYSEFERIKSSHPYRIVAKDIDSVAILYRDSILEAERIQHIHFEGDRYWISLGRSREWFQKEAEPCRPANVGKPRHR